MKCFSYKMDHDFGLAPNPFGGVMSLAVCKGQIRNNRNLEIGDWIVGTGSKAMGCEGVLIYAMKLEQKITFDEYWNDPLYARKKPVLNGSLLQMYGDNFYHTGDDGFVIQEPSAHSNEDNTPNEGHTRRDASGKYVLLSNHFYYFGDKAPMMPAELNGICSHSRSYHFWDIDEELLNQFVSWLETNFTLGIHGDPRNWKEFNLPQMEIYEY